MHAMARLSLLLVAFVLAWGSLAPALPVGAGVETPPEDEAAAEQPPEDGNPQNQDDQQIQGDIQVQGDLQVEGDQQVQGNQLITNDATSTPLDPAMVLALVLVLLLVALFALSEIFRYLRDGREDYYKTFREFARKGVYVSPVMVDAITERLQPGVMTPEGAIQESPQAPDRFVLTGPGILPVGESGIFNAVLNDAPADGTQWRITTPEGGEVPAISATLEPPAGGSTTFTGLKPGSYRLTATLPGFEMSPPTTTITVIEPPTAAGEIPSLPFIGEGYGSIVGAILLLAVVVVLAATRAIDADIIGVLLGSIAGYLFGVGINRNTS